MVNKATGTKKVIGILNDLVEVCKDGENGFRTAADGFDNEHLRMECLQYAEQRYQFAQELQQKVRSLGGDPEQSGSISGKLHRGWINIKSVVTGKDEAAIVSECERGEDVAKETYEKAADAYLPPAVAGLVQRQYEQVKQVHDRFSLLEKQQKAA